MQDHNRGMMRSAGTLAMVAAVCAVWLAGPARAEIYRCTVDGVLAFSDRPCQPDAAPVDVPDAIVVPEEPGVADLARRHDARIEAYGKARSEEDAAWRQDYEQRSAEEARLRAARARREVVRGMHASDVVRLLGEPGRKTATSGARSARETWIYADEGQGGLTVTLRNDVVTDVRRKKRR